jgi:alginate O-acetyltransferase complex protein AlgI
MLFNSLHFLIFFPIVVITYYLVPHKFRWILLLSASYYFYMVWNPIYVILILVSTFINYYLSILIYKTPKKVHKKLYLAFSIIFSLGMLFLFKYFDLFITSFNQLTSNNFDLLYLILPMGISFYTFQTLSYTIDVFRGDREPEYHIGYFSLYVIYFPQLVAGPIERSDKLIPELRTKVTYDSSQIIEGLKKMTWGFFKKMVIADNLAIAVNHVYSDVEAHTGLTLLLATIFFAFQIFADFSGYSDIAIGASKVMGIDLMENFKRPYFSTSLKEFWSRWHISLSTWFRDYVYIPLGGSKKGKVRTYINTFIVFLLSGLWHGASWMFVVWGAAHGVYLIIERLIGKTTNQLWTKLKLDNSILKWIVRWSITMMFVLFTWVFFRSENFSDSIYIISKIFNDVISLQILQNIFISISSTNIGLIRLIVVFVSIILLELNHLLEERFETDYFRIGNKYVLFKWFKYYFIIFWILIFAAIGQSEFIYFQF